MGIVRTADQSATVQLGERFGTLLVPNDVVLLSGSPGAGKTWFTKGIAKALGVKDLVNSPSFSLINEYSGKLKLYHFDLYRLGTCAEVASLGCEEYFSSGGVCVFEWPERCPGFFPKDCMAIRIDIVDESIRDFHFPELDRQGDRLYV